MTEQIKQFSNDDKHVLALVRERAEALVAQIKVLQYLECLPESQRGLLIETNLEMRKALLQLDEQAYVSSWGEEQHV